MTRNIGQKQTADPPGGATGNVVDVAASLSLAEWFAVDPGIEPGQFYSTGRNLAPSPNLHALHMLCLGSRHLSSSRVALSRRHLGCRYMLRRRMPIRRNLCPIYPGEPYYIRTFSSIGLPHKIAI